MDDQYPPQQYDLRDRLIKAQWHKLAKQDKRIEDLSRRDDNAQAYIARLEAQLTPQAIAERSFRHDQ